MKIEVWSDFVCPYCYIGKRKLEAALEQFPHRDQVEIVYKSFELDPDMPKEGSPDVYTMLATKYGLTHEQAIESTNQVAQQAKVVGLDFHFARTIQTNTFDAHRLAHYAAAQGKGREMTERLLKAHFTDGLHVGDPSTLADLAVEVGLNKDDVLRVLNSGDYATDVRSDEQEAQELGARGVPFFVINRKYGIAGAQPLDIFMQALQRAWDEM